MTSAWKKCGLALVLAGIILYLLLLDVFQTASWTANAFLWIATLLGGIPFFLDMMVKLFHGRFGADFLAATSVATALWMEQVMIAAIIVLMLAGGEVLEDAATRRASKVLSMLAKRSPSIAHRRADNQICDIPVMDVVVGDTLIVFPHEICPVDGSVLQGDSTMDEAFLTGEPFRLRKTTGATVLSGAINGESALTILAEKLAVDSRYARIMQVVEDAEKSPPPLRRLGDQLGVLYTPLALIVALGAWYFSRDSHRFLAVLVIATPCPLLLAIPSAVVGAISLAAKRGIIIKKPVVLEQMSHVRTMLFDKTGTLTHAEPELTEFVNLSSLSNDELLGMVASLEQYSRHPLSAAVQMAARIRGLSFPPVESVRERPGQGLTGTVSSHIVAILGRKFLSDEAVATLPAFTSGMEAVVTLDGTAAALMRFHDRPRKESKPFMDHLRPKHHIQRVLIISGDRDEEVRRLARIVGVSEVRSGLTPEEKVRIVREETAHAPTLFLGDGINDAPAMLAATVGVAFGGSSDITTEAASAVVLDSSLERVDELMHIGRRMRKIALESAIGGMGLSLLGMVVAAFGLLPPLWGAISQEVIDVVAVLNALRVSVPQKNLQDFKVPAS